MTATATNRRAKPDAKVLARRKELCEQRLDIERRLKPDYERIEVIDAELKKIATDAGESFAENVFGKGDVSVSPGHDAEFKGKVPQVQIETWDGLKKSDQNALTKSGVIKIVDSWGKRSSGRVTVKALSAAAAST
jgi:hypothetical protein